MQKIVLSYSLILSILTIGLSFNSASAFDVYKVDLNSLNSYKIIKKGTVIELALLNNLSSLANQTKNPAKFQIIDNDSLSLSATGTITMLSSGKRLSMFANAQISTDKLFLDNGEEVYFSANSPLIQAVHPPHPGNNNLGLARAITNLSIASSPATFGASLGINFLISGLLSAYHNGISDFFWGGFSGSGLSFLERVFRKQPDLFLPSGTTIPFVLNQDLKISNGIKKETAKPVNLTNDEALARINKMLEWGDLTGALELALKTGQEEIYSEILKKISS